MPTKPLSAEIENGPVRQSAASRALRLIFRLPLAIVLGVVKAAVYSAWYLVFYILCMFRPFTGFMILTAIVMVPMSIAVFFHPEAANGMPFWAFGLMAMACRLRDRLHDFPRLVHAAWCRGSVRALSPPREISPSPSGTPRLRCRERVGFNENARPDRM